MSANSDFFYSCAVVVAVAHYLFRFPTFKTFTYNTMFDVFKIVIIRQKSIIK